MNSFLLGSGLPGPTERLIVGRGRILVSGEDAATRIAVNHALARAGYSARGTSDAATLWKWVRQGDGDAVITDVFPAEEEALSLISRIRDIRPDLPVIVLTAQNGLMTAIKITEQRAYEYLSKPFDIRKLVKVVERALQNPTKASPLLSPSHQSGDPSLVGHSAQMQVIHRLLARLLCTDLPVLITGESGTGKTLAAHTLHDCGPRHRGPFVALNMAAIPFAPDEQGLTGTPAWFAGHFQQAKGGTLLLDEIGDMPMQAQTCLVRNLLDDSCLPVGDQTPVKTDVRIIAATNKNLADQISLGLFREDLFYRLNVIPLHMPPLRDHLEDVSDLVQHFQRAAEHNGHRAKTFTQDAVQRLKRYRWPGNTRELRNFVERIYALDSDEIISADIVDSELPAESGGRDQLTGSETSLRQSVQAYLSEHLESFDGQLPPLGLYGRIMRDVEEPLLSAALMATGGNQAKTARLLGLNRSTLRKKLREQKHG